MSRLEIAAASKSTQEGENLTTQERTLQFFRQDLKQLNDALQGRVIVHYGFPDKKVHISATRMWPVAEVSESYTQMSEMEPGTVWIPQVAVARNNPQFLIIATDRGQEGACVEIMSANLFNGDSGRFERRKTTARRAVPDYFILGKDDTGQLQFLDDTDTLYFVTGQFAGNRPVELPSGYTKSLERTANKPDANSIFKNILFPQHE